MLSLVSILAVSVSPTAASQKNSREYLQRNVANGDIDGIKDREHEHDHAFPLAKLCRSENAQQIKDIGTDGPAEGVDRG